MGPRSLRDWLAAASTPHRYLWSDRVTVRLDDLIRGSSLGSLLADLVGQSVLVRTRDQISTALALIELDGVARRIVVCPPDIPSDRLGFLIENAEVDAILYDYDRSEVSQLGVSRCIAVGSTIEPMANVPTNRQVTEWVLLTSATTGLPKMVVHTLAGLTGAIKGNKSQPIPVIWGTFYDIRRYGGLQVFFRTILGAASFIMMGFDESLSEYLNRLRGYGATHVLGTPSHWRRLLMSPTAGEVPLRYVRLSGEIADQAILNNLRSCYPQAEIVHAYASTEAGVGFEVTDGLEGFPTSTLNARPGGIELKIEDGSLHIRSGRTAVRYLGGDSAPLMDQDSFVDTGDMVELRNGRYYFLGRRGGIINIGGLKVHPEEVEAVINRHPEVRICRVRGRSNPFTGSIVVADVVLRQAPERKNAEEENLKHEILHLCKEVLARHKIPASIEFVPSLNFSAAGKLVRRAAS